MMYQIITGALITLMTSQVSFAHEDYPSLSRKSLSLAAQLNQLARLNERDLCAGDINIAAAYTHSAGIALTLDKPQSAAVSLAYAQNELKEISYNRSYCHDMASKTKPYLAEVIVIKGELDAKTNPSTKSVNGYLQ